MRFISENCFLILSFVFYSFLFERNIMYFQKIYLKTFAEVDFYSTKINTPAWKYVFRIWKSNPYRGDAE